MAAEPPARSCGVTPCLDTRERLELPRLDSHRQVSSTASLPKARCLAVWDVPRTVLGHKG